MAQGGNMELGAQGAAVGLPLEEHPAVLGYDRVTAALWLQLPAGWELASLEHNDGSGYTSDFADGTPVGGIRASFRKA